MRSALGAAHAVTLEVTALGAAGDGVATVDGVRAFVPGALPGERVRALPAARRAGQSVFAIEALLTRSPDRVQPPCPHFGACGGCAVQHLADAAYARWKTALLTEALARAGFRDPPLAPLVRTPPGARRRADFAIARRSGRAVHIGFHARRGSAVTDLAACPVLDARLAGLIDPLRGLLGGLPSLVREGAAVVNLLDYGADLLLRTEAAPDAAQRAQLVAFARAHRLCRLSWADAKGPPEPIVQRAPPVITLSGRPVTAPPGAFLQASPQGEAAIVAAVLAGLPGKAGRIADLYAGLGTLSFALATRASVVACEGDAAAHAALAAAAGGARVQAVRRDLARQPLQPDELVRFDAVVLDPPFAGAAAQCAALAASRVPHVAYVSCNPAALARDAGLLRRAGFALRAAAPIDQFLWSASLEAVVHLAR